MWKFEDLKELVVIGDVHGNLGHLRELVCKIGERWPGVAVVLTGDVCDRGPHTKEVIQYLIDREWPCVMGNHDLWLRKAALSGVPEDVWLHPNNGGKQTLASYRTEGGNVLIPRSHAEWVARLPLSLKFPGVRVDGRPVVVTHAPLNRPVEELDVLSPWNAQHASWIYDAPWQQEGLFGVCGHMMYPEPTRRGNVFSVDTGCGAGGALSAVKLPELETVSVGGNDDIKEAIRNHSLSYPSVESPSKRREDAAAAFAELLVDDDF